MVLNLDYRSFNATLVALGRPYAPIHNAEGQQSAFAAHLSIPTFRRSFEALRAMHLALFDAGNDLPDYVAASSETRAGGASPVALGRCVGPRAHTDPGWVAEFDLPSDDLMDHRIDGWINAVGAHPGDVTLLRPLDDVRSANRRIIASFVDRARPIVGAWAGKHSEVDPPTWARPDQASELVEQFVTSGRLDFRELTENLVILTVMHWGKWPVGMPTTLSLPELGITTADLADQQSAGEKARWLLEQERRTVALDGHRVSR